MSSLLATNVHRAFYPDDKEIIIEKGLYQNDRENKEYTFYIDTAFRNFNENPNPFQFTIEMSPLAGSKNILFPTKIDEANYLFFRQVILPLRLLTENIVNQRFVVLRIKELNMPYQYFCSSKINPQTDIILYNVGIQGYNMMLEAKSVITFRDDIKPKLTKMTFQFLTYDGEIITIPNNLQGASIEDSMLVYDKSDIDINEIYETKPEVNPHLSFNNVFIEMKIGVNDVQILSKP